MRRPIIIYFYLRDFPDLKETYVSTLSIRFLKCPSSNLADDDRTLVAETQLLVPIQTLTQVARAVHSFTGTHGAWCNCWLKNLNPKDLNNTAKAELDILLYNRVAKAGSMTMMRLLGILSKHNGFYNKPVPIRGRMAMSFDEETETEYAETLINMNEGIAITDHVSFINFEQYSLPKPIYINIIRDPIERVISWHQYIRTPWYYFEVKKNNKYYPAPKVPWIKMSFEECVLKQKEDCNFQQDSRVDGAGVFRQMTFFCGRDYDDCFPFNSKTALQISKANVERHYAVVGSWEDRNVTLTVLEHYIPRFFMGALELYYLHKDNLDTVNHNPTKSPVRPEIKDMIKANFSSEYEFYDFCKQRLYKQYLAIRLLKGYNTFS